MVNLRYHIVSLIAVFLALGIGVVMGSTVIDRGVVDALNNKVNDVDNRVRRTDAENHRLSGQVEVGHNFADQALDHVLRGRLKGVPVVTMATEGIDRKPVESLAQALANAQAVAEGTVWFTTKMRLDNPGDAQALADALGVPAEAPDVVRALALTRLATAVAGGPGSNPLATLSQAGFVSYEPPSAAGSATSLSLGSLPLAGSRVVVVSGAGADVGDDQLGLPLARQLVKAAVRVVAAEAGRDTPGGRGVFVGLLRRDADVAARLSTVDDLESSMGEAATVLALDDLGVARTGHFGVGPGAQRLLPTVRP
jgi:hypothetical protein